MTVEDSPIEDEISLSGTQDDKDLGIDTSLTQAIAIIVSVLKTINDSFIHSFN